MYTRNGSKNHSGSGSYKFVANPDLRNRCYVYLLKKYFSLLPVYVVYNVLLST